MKRIIIAVLFLSMTATTMLLAQPDSISQDEMETVEGGSLSDYEMTLWEDTHFVTSMIVILFSLLVFSLILFRIKVKRLDPESYLKLIIVFLVVTASMFLISAGWDNNQTAPAFGLLGTIVGYLLGQNSSNGKASEQKEEQSETAGA